jgi:hypothetical protein
VSQLEKLQLFRREEKPLAGVMQSHQKNVTSPLAAILENRRVMLFQWVDIVSGPVGKLKMSVFLF